MSKNTQNSRPSLGLKVTLSDPENPQSVICAQFATGRSYPELIDILRNIARLDVAENVALRKLAAVSSDLESAKSAGEIETMGKRLSKLRAEADDATIALLCETRLFVERGFELAGATKERSEWLADRVSPENVPELKAKCLFGAGCLDFTIAPARS